MALSFVALVAIWPCDTLDQAEAKLALAEAHGPILPGYERDFVRGLEPEHARRLRWKRAAFEVGSLMLPPGPAAPQDEDRGLSTWPLARFDLRGQLPPRGGLPEFAHDAIPLWAAFADQTPDLPRLARQAAAMFETADRLAVLATQAPETGVELLKASEGARIAAYLAGGQAMIWPAYGAADVAAKKAICSLVNNRAEVADPIHMQGAMRHLAAEACWVNGLRPSARTRFDYDWVETV